MSIKLREIEAGTLFRFVDHYKTLICVIADGTIFDRMYSSAQFQSRSVTYVVLIANISSEEDDRETEHCGFTFPMYKDTQVVPLDLIEIPKFIDKPIMEKQ